MRNELNRMVQGVTDPAKKKVSSVSPRRLLDAVPYPSGASFAQLRALLSPDPSCVQNTQKLRRHAGRR